MSASAWVDSRLPAEVVHLDAAACGRPSAAVLDAEIAVLRAEASRGGYVAAELAEPAISAGREELGRLLGLDRDAVAFSDGAGTSFALLLEAWPLGPGARVGTVSSEYGANAMVLRRLADSRGWQLVPLPVDGLGRIAGLEPDLDLLTFPHVASQRGIVQPVQAMLDAGVPVLLDVAQSLGQTPVPAGCAAYVGTSRKWLGGPRGVGFAVVDPAVEPRLTAPPFLTAHDDVRRLDSQEAHIGGRAGLAAAVAEWTPAVLSVVHARAAYARQVLAETPWRVVEPVGEPTGITTLVGADPVATRSALLDRGLLVSAIPVTRAPDLRGPVLRVSTAAWVTEADLDALADALRAIG